MAALRLSLVSALVFLSLSLANTLAAQETAAVDSATPKPQYPQSGVLSRSATTGYQSKNFEMPWDKKGNSADPDTPAPISGSVSKSGDRQWLARIFNNSEDTYSVSLRVVQRGRSGGVVKSDSFSYTLKPNERAERAVGAAVGSTDATLDLQSWKNLSGNKKKAETAAAAQATAAPTAQVMQRPVSKK